MSKVYAIILLALSIGLLSTVNAQIHKAVSMGYAIVSFIPLFLLYFLY